MAEDKRFFYVMGGEYTDETFETLMTRTNKIHGPYETRADAEAKWRDLAFKTTGQGLVKYEIVEIHHKMSRGKISGMIFHEPDEV